MAVDIERIGYIDTDQLAEAVSDPLSGTFQGLNANLTGFSSLPGTVGIVEQTAPSTYAVRLTGVGAATSLLTRADGDARYAGAGTGVLSFNTRTGAVTLTSADVTTALTYTPTSITGLTGAQTAAAVRTGLSLVPGTDVQAYDADLAALAANATNGLWARTGAGTGSARTITGTANEITVTNGDGVSGNPTASLPAALTFTGKTITGGAYSAGTISNFTSFSLIANASPADNKRWDIIPSGQTILFRTLNDAGSAAQTYMQVTRAGGIPITEVYFPNGTTRIASLRLDQTATAAVVAQTHHVPININGVVYKLLLAT